MGLQTCGLNLNNAQKELYPHGTPGFPCAAYEGFYMLQYRVTKGAELLLREPEKSVSQIGLLCGFDSPSHFSKMFRRFYDCSPKEYRNF